MDFIIYALPRSGTAWLSNFLTYGNSFCYHDPFPPFILPTQANHTGFITTLGHKLKVPAAKSSFALIRNPEDIELSCQRLKIANTETPETIRDFEFLTRTMPKFYYEELFDIEYLRRLWKTVVGPGFHEARASALIDLRVEADLVRYAAKYVRERRES